MDLKIEWLIYPQFRNVDYSKTEWVQTIECFHTRNTIFYSYRKDLPKILSYIQKRKSWFTATNGAFYILTQNYKHFI